MSRSHIGTTIAISARVLTLRLFPDYKVSPVRSARLNTVSLLAVALHVSVGLSAPLSLVCDEHHGASDHHQDHAEAVGRTTEASSPLGVEDVEGCCQYEVGSGPTLLSTPAAHDRGGALVAEVAPSGHVLPATRARNERGRPPRDRWGPSFPAIATIKLQV